jgi:hypothetical protein
MKNTYSDNQKNLIEKLTNKDRLCDRRKPQSYPVLDKPDLF